MIGLVVLEIWSGNLKSQGVRSFEQACLFGKICYPFNSFSLFFIVFWVLGEYRIGRPGILAS